LIGYALIAIIRTAFSGKNRFYHGVLSMAIKMPTRLRPTRWPLN